MDFKIADILYFERYFFTDNNSSAPHFALVLLPSSILPYRFSNSLLCAVITSKEPKSFFIELSKKKYIFFSKDSSYVCFDRQDINSINDLDAKQNQPLGALDKIDIKLAFKKIKDLFYSTRGKHLCQSFKINKFLIATTIREWKKYL